MNDNCPTDYSNSGITGAYVEEVTENNINNNERLSINNEDSNVYVGNEFTPNF